MINDTVKKYTLRVNIRAAGIFAVDSAFSLSNVACHIPSRRLELTTNLSGIPII